MLVETDNLPAMKGAPAPSGGLSADVAAAWQKLNDVDGIIPYLDYTTPTFYDDITAAIQELMGGKQDPQQFTSGVQKAYDKWSELPLTAVTTTASAGSTAALEAAREPAGASSADRPPGEPRLVGYLYLLPAFVVFAAFVLAAARARGLALAVQVGRADRRHVGRAGELRRRVQRPGAALVVRARR